MLGRKAWLFWEGWLAEQAPRRTDISGAARVLPILAFTLAGSVLALGALQLPFTIAAAVGATGSAFLALRYDSRRLDRAALLLFALGAWSLLQACPLPIGLLRVIAPKNAAIWSRAFEVTGGTARWVSISLDPGGSVVEALKWTSYGAAAIAAAFVARQVGLRVIAGLTFLLALLVAVTTLAHGLVHARALFGIYVPTFDPGPWGFGPLINPNNRAGYLNLGAFAGLSLLVSRSHQGRRWPIVVGVGGLVAVSVLARSRGGLVGLAAGSLVLLVSLLRKAVGREGARRGFYLRAALPPLLALVGGLVLAGLGGDGKTWSMISKEGAGKLQILWWTRPMLADFPFFGVGRGAFETVFPAYNQIGAHQIHHHAENFVIDWITEWGAVVAVPALLAFALLLRRRPNEQPSRSTLRLALGVLLLQNLVDHGLEMPATALLAVTIVAALATEQRTEIVAAPPLFLGPRRVALSVGVAALAVAAVAWGKNSSYQDRQVLSTAVRELPSDDPDDARLLLDEISASVHRHPADPFLPLLGATTARHVPGARPIRWLGWALERHMMSGHTHFTAAYFLLRAHATGQALSELRVAAERDPALRPRAAEWAIRYVQRPEDALRAVPDGPDGVTMLLVLAGSSRLETLRLDLLEEATARDPSSTMAHTAAARAFLAALESAGTSTCHFAQQPICLEHLNHHLLAIARLEPGSSLATELTARMLAATGRASEARTLLSSTCNSFAKPATCWQARIGLGRDQLSDPALQEAVQAYHSAACTTDDACIRASMWLGGALEQRGDNMGALEYYSRAVRAGSDTSKTWLAIARVARAAGQPKRATEALQRAQRSSKDPDLRRALDRSKLNSMAEGHPQ